MSGFQEFANFGKNNNFPLTRMINKILDE